MKKLLAACAGLALIGSVGATQLEAQRVTIRKGDRSVTIENDRRTRSAHAHDETCNEGYYRTVKKKVWVPGHYDTIEKRVWVPGRHVTVRERRVDRHGCVIYVNVCRFVPGHYEMRTERVYHPGHYKVVTEQVWVPATRAKPGHAHSERPRGNARARNGNNRGRGNARGRGSRGRGR